MVKKRRRWSSRARRNSMFHTRRSVSTFFFFFSFLFLRGQLFFVFGVVLLDAKGNRISCGKGPAGADQGVCGKLPDGHRVFGQEGHWRVFRRQQSLQPWCAEGVHQDAWFHWPLIWQGPQVRTSTLPLLSFFSEKEETVTPDVLQKIPVWLPASWRGPEDWPHYGDLCLSVSREQSRDLCLAWHRLRAGILSDYVEHRPSQSRREEQDHKTTVLQEQQGNQQRWRSLRTLSLGI